jgi:hypothetical protein
MSLKINTCGVSDEMESSVTGETDWGVDTLGGGASFAAFPDD